MSGVIIAHGNVGKYLEHRVELYDTYITLDGGIKWNMLKLGLNYVIILDNIGILVIALCDAKTNQISYGADLSNSKAMKPL